jgi:uncharacterized protein (TIGR00369 family)
MPTEPDRRYTHTTPGCFGCGEDNPAGLGLRPYHDGEWIAADFEPKPHHRGMSKVVHGGIIGSALDEVVTCAASIAAGALTATVSLQLEFLAPMLLGQRYHVRARPTGIASGRHLAEGEILDGAGQCVARARGQFVALSPERAARFLRG